MNIILYILWFATIHIHIINGKNDISFTQLETFFNKLVEANWLNGNEEFDAHMACEESLFFYECYEKLVDNYEKKLKPKVIQMIDNAIQEKIHKFKVLVLSFMTILTKEPVNTNKAGNIDDESTVDLDNIFEAISMKDSKIYCALGFLNHLNVDIKKTLNDYILLADVKFLAINVKTISDLKNRIDKYFGSSNETNGNQQINVSKSEMIEMLTQEKKKIKTFSVPFCDLESELGLKWVPIKILRWKNFQESKILSEDKVNGESLLYTNNIEVEAKMLAQSKNNYFKSSSFKIKKKEDLKNADTIKKKKKSKISKRLTEETMQKINNLPTPMTNYTEESQLVKLTPLNTIFEAAYSDIEFNKVDDFYHIVSFTTDQYLLKVVFNRVLFIAISSMTKFCVDMKTLQTDKNKNDFDFQLQYEERFLQHISLGEEIILFQMFFELYSRLEPFTMDTNTYEDIMSILDFIMDFYMSHDIANKKEISDMEKSIDAIKKYLDDKRFRQNATTNVDNPQNTTINIDSKTFEKIKIPDVKALFDEMKQINKVICTIVGHKTI